VKDIAAFIVDRGVNYGPYPSVEIAETVLRTRLGGSKTAVIQELVEIDRTTDKIGGLYGNLSIQALKQLEKPELHITIFGTRGGDVQIALSPWNAKILVQQLSALLNHRPEIVSA